MLSDLIFSATPLPDQPAIITPERSTSWRALQTDARRMIQEHQSLEKRRVGLQFGPPAACYAILAALDQLNSDVFLLDETLSWDEVGRVAEKFRLGAVLSGSAQEGAEFVRRELGGEDAWSGASTVTILTSGSTGEPKAARHAWESLGRPVRKSTEQSTRNWLLTYRPNLYAGLQVMLQCFADHGTLVIPSREHDPYSVTELMYTSGVQFVSATPSYWRRLLMFGDSELLKKVPLVQITLGGEVVDQSILDKLRQRFPKARIVHLYATTELGRCFSVSDGMAGFPASYLDHRLPDRVELRVEANELFARSPNAMRMYDPRSIEQASVKDWFATGDLVEVRENRVYFVGRKTDMINVAGSKVHPVEVECVIRDIPGVSDVRVFAKSSSIAGELVACDVVPAPDQDPETLRDTIIQICRTKLASSQRPRLIRLVTQIGMSPAGKTLRGKTS